MILLCVTFNGSLIPGPPPNPPEKVSTWAKPPPGPAAPIPANEEDIMDPRSPPPKIPPPPPPKPRPPKGSRAPNGEPPKGFRGAGAGWISWAGREKVRTN